MNNNNDNDNNTVYAYNYNDDDFTDDFTDDFDDDYEIVTDLRCNIKVTGCNYSYAYVLIVCGLTSEYYNIHTKTLTEHGKSFVDDAISSTCKEVAYETKVKNSFKFTFYCLKCKKKLMAFLWRRVREPKIMKELHPKNIALKLSIFDELSLDTDMDTIF